MYGVFLKLKFFIETIFVMIYVLISNVDCIYQKYLYKMGQVIVFFFTKLKLVTYHNVSREDPV